MFQSRLLSKTLYFNHCASRTLRRFGFRMVIVTKHVAAHEINLLFLKKQILTVMFH